MVVKISLQTRIIKESMGGSLFSFGDMPSLSQFPTIDVFKLWLKGRNEDAEVGIASSPTDNPVSRFFTEHYERTPVVISRNGFAVENTYHTWDNCDWVHFIDAMKCCMGEMLTVRKCISLLAQSKDHCENRHVRY